MQSGPAPKSQTLSARGAKSPGRRPRRDSMTWRGAAIEPALLAADTAPDIRAAGGGPPLRCRMSRCETRRVHWQSGDSCRSAGSRQAWDRNQKRARWTVPTGLRYSATYQQRYRSFFRTEFACRCKDLGSQAGFVNISRLMISRRHIPNHNYSN